MPSLFYHRFISLFLVIFYISLVNNQTKAQNPAFISLANENVIPSKQVYDLFLDKSGCVWIGHNKGINRYSGYTSKYFTHPLMNSFELSNILQDDNGTIWCSNFVGQIFYIKNDQINLLNKEKAYNFFNRAGLAYGNKKIYFVENNDLLEVDINSFKTERYKFKNFNQIFSYCYMPNLGLLLYTDKGMFKFVNNKLQLYSKCYDAKKLLLIKAVGNDILGVDFVRRTVHKLVGNSWEFCISSDKTNSDITTVTKLKNNFYTNTYNGVLQFNSKNQKVTHFLKGYGVSDEILDNEGNIWVSTLYNGVLIIPEDNNIKKLLPNNENITAVCMLDDKNQIALGTKNGKIFIVDKTDLEIIKEISLSEIKNIENIYYNKKANQLNISTLKHTVLNLSNYQLSTTGEIHNAKSIISYNNQLLFVNSGSLSVINSNFSKFIKHKPNWPSLIKNQQSKKRWDIIANERFFRVVRFEKRNLFLASSSNNIYWFNNDTLGIVKFKNNNISAKNMFCFNNVVYASQNNKGLYIINDTNQAELFDTLPFKSISSFCVSGNNLMLNTNLGLFSFNLKTHHVQNISNKYNLTTQSFDLILGDKDYIYATEANSIIRLNNTFNRVSNYKIPINITKILVNNVEHKSITKLAHTENNISIYFDVISYKIPRNVIIKYRLNPDDDWKEINAQQGYINISLLPPGNYHFQMEVANYQGLNPVEINFEIKQPYYRSWWFIVLIVLLSSGFVMFIMYLRIQNIRYKNKLLLEKIMLEKDLRQSLLTSIRTQMNPHFIFNALNTIHSFIYTNDKKNASEYLVKFSDLTRLVLEMSEKESVSLKEEIQALELYLSLENVRFNEMLEYNFIIDSAIVKDYIRIPPMIIQPYVENAIKHGLLHKKNDKRISIYFTLNNQVLIITIEDNGIGRYKSNEINKSRSKTHKSFSTQANKKRIEILNQDKDKLKTGVEIIDLYDEQKRPLGTRVIIEVPVVIV